MPLAGRSKALAVFSPTFSDRVVTFNERLGNDTTEYLCEGSKVA
jgi:hypothetical protein